MTLTDILLIGGALALFAVLIPLTVWLDRRETRLFFERHGRYPTADDYPPGGLGGP